MDITNTIVLFNILFWIIPVFRQYRDGYFYYFLTLAASGVLIWFLIYTLKIHPMYTSLLMSFSAVLAVLYYTRKRKRKWIIAAVLIVILPLGSPDIARLGVFVLHGIILYYFMSLLARDMANTDNINMYFIILILYESSILLKISARIVNVYTGMYFFYITTAFEILIAVYFIFYNLRNSPKLKLEENLS